MNSRKPKARFNLDIGCGANCQPGFVGMDVRKLPGVEIVHDVEKFPWPLESGAVSVAMASHLVEHIKPWLTIQFMDEVWRILEDNGLLLISTPYAGSYRYFQDPTHCNPWNEATVTYFLEGSSLYQIYQPKPWKAEKLTWFVHGDLEVALRKVRNGNSG